MNNYQILLCENFYEGESLQTKEVCEVGSLTSSFSGKARNVVFYTNIDGTHELSFDLLRYYFDEEQGEIVENELSNYIANKSQLILRDLDNDKEYHFTVNQRVDRKDNNIFLYSYTCGDTYIEELSKTGYSLTYTAEIEGGGLGTIHELAESILKDTDWEYVKDKQEDGSGTGQLLEYSTDLEYNLDQHRFDTKYIPQPVHPIRYIDKVERYCNQLDLFYQEKVKVEGGEKILYHPIYCYEDSRQIVSSSAKNMIYNADEFLDTTGWSSIRKEKKNGKYTGKNLDGIHMYTKRVKTGENDEAGNPIYDYCLRLTRRGEVDSGFIVNTTSADSNNTIQEYQPYLFRYQVDTTEPSDERGWISSIRIYDKNPLDTSVKNMKTAAVYSYSRKFLPGRYYVIKIPRTIYKPYFAFGVQVPKRQGKLAVKKFSFFEVKGKETQEEIDGITKTITAEENNLDLISKLTDKKVLKIKNSDGTYNESTKKYLDKMHLLEDEPSVSAYTDKKTIYFYIDNNNEVRTLKFEELCGRENSENSYYLKGDIDNNGEVDKDDYNLLRNYLNEGESEGDPSEEPENAGDLELDDNATDSETTEAEDNDIDYSQFDFYRADLDEDGDLSENDLMLLDGLIGKEDRVYFGNPIFKKNSNSYENFYYDFSSIEDVEALPEEGEENKIYRLTTDNNYYQYYKVTREGTTNGAWDLAFYGSGVSDKRRTLIAEKSNRFNLLQELAELFKAWCVFDVKKNSDNTLSKRIWFKEKAINQNFSGFHSGVNLQSIERTMDSQEIVTKLYVEDVESEFAENGFVTIRTAKLSPCGENFYYNFKHYVDQGLLNGDILNSEINELYAEVGNRNKEILSLNEKIIPTNLKISDLSTSVKTITYSIVACDDRITKLEAEKEANEKKMSKQDKKNLNNEIKEYKEKKKKYEKEKDILEADKILLEQKVTDWTETVEKLQEQKMDYISNFEKKYSSYIKEGVWSDSSYVDNDTYFIDSQKVFNTSAMPNTSWTISALDGSVFKELEDYKVSVGDQTILVDNEFFGVKKNPEQNYTFEVLVTGIREHLDEKTQNEIEVRNYLTSFDDIFQRMGAATQTVELKEQTYDKAAYFTSDKTVDKDILQKSLLDNALTLASSSDNSYTLNEAGLLLQSKINPAKKMRAIADGIFFSNSTSLANGEPEWKTGITAEGINASILTAGEINTSLIKIFSDGQPCFSWNELGITSYSLKEGDDGERVNDGSFIRLDGFGLYSVDKDVSDEDENRAFFQYNTTGEPWFKGKTYDDAVKEIRENSVFSITNKGFRLNVQNEGKVLLGHKEDNGTGEYGLFIYNNKNDSAPVVSLNNSGVNKIGGWTITNTGLKTYINEGENEEDDADTEESQDSDVVVTSAQARSTKYYNWEYSLKGATDGTSNVFYVRKKLPTDDDWTYLARITGTGRIYGSAFWLTRMIDGKKHSSRAIAMETDGRIFFPQTVYFSGSAIPKTDNRKSLGNSSSSWKSIHCNHYYLKNNLFLEKTDGGNNKFIGNSYFEGKVASFKDNEYTLGDSDNKWKQLYAGTSTISTSDYNKKKDIRSLSEKYENFFMKLSPVSYLFKDGTSGRTHIGFISQDVEKSLSDTNLTALDFAGFCKDLKEDSTDEWNYALRYSEFIALNTHMIQKLYRKNSELEEKVRKLEETIEKLQNKN